VGISDYPLAKLAEEEYGAIPWANSTWRKFAPDSQVISWPATLIFTIIYIFLLNSFSTIKDEIDRLTQAGLIA